jgi:dipeptidyl-peptidase-4
MLRPTLPLSILLTMSFSATTHAADPEFLRQHAETRGFLLGRPVGTRPTPDGRSILFLRSPARSPVLSLYEFDVASGKARELLTPEQLLKGAEEQLSPEERAQRERKRISTRGFTSFELSQDGAQILLTLSGRLYTVRRSDNTVRGLKTGNAPVLNPHFSPDGQYVSFVRGGDLYVLELKGNKETRLTTSPDPRITNGLAEFVAQEEMMRYQGYWWSPDSRQIAFEQADNRNVETLRIADLSHPEREPEATAYPRPGKANAEVRLGVVPVTGGSISWVQWDRKKFPYLAQVVWKEGGPLTVVVVSREQHDLEVLVAEPHGTSAVATRRLVAEHDDAWINLDQSLPRWLRDGSGFLWSSEREGVRRLELHGADGRLTKVLRVTDGGAEAEFGALLSIDDKARQAYVIASAEPTEKHVFRVPLNGSAATRLSTAPGYHFASFSEDHHVYVMISSTLETLPASTVHVIDGKKERAAGDLPSVAENPPFVSRPELVRVGTQNFRAAVVRPRNFDPKRKYPVVVDVYGGPHANQVSRSQAGFLRRQWIADQGFIVVSADGRGTPGRGRTWERAIRGDFAGVTLDDQVAALKALGAKYPEMDLGRVGIFGWSFGGYMAALAVLRRPDVFHVGVAGAPVTEWMDYDTCYTERYLGMPETNAEGYRKSSLLTYAESLSRPLLLIHGTSDDNVYFTHTLKLSEALFRAGKPFGLLPLSGFTHIVPDPLVQERLWTRIVDALAAALHPGQV